MVSRVVVVGASGFGRECLDVLDAMVAAGDPIEIVGVLDDAPSEMNLQRLAARGVAYLGTVADWLQPGPEEVRFVLGIGSPQVRRVVAGRLEAAGLHPFTVIHPSAVVGSQPGFAEGVVICAGAVVSTNVSLGRYVHINPNATVGHDSTLEDFVSVNPAAVVSGEVLVGQETLLGAQSIVLQGLRIGRNTVTKDVADNVVVKGVPARVD
jgi:sugar O-acyltransferase (sialic acid O-acetyltransferase NeuD family)